MTWPRRPRARERGSVVIEFLGLALLLGVPLVYLVMAAAHFQAAALGSVTMAEQLARLQATAPQDGVGTRLETATGEMAAAAGLPREAVDVAVSCAPSCGRPGALVTVTVRITVALPFLPDGVGSVSAQALARAPRFG